MNIYITGDIHGSPGAIRSRIAQIEDPTEEDVIIVCGDAGFEYTSQYIMDSAKKAAAKFPGSWIILRGNHDSRYWEDHADLKYNANGRLRVTPHGTWSLTDNKLYLYQKQYPNIKYVRDDGGIYQVGNYNFLFIPGAFSVDKDYRLINGFPWNSKEQLNFTEYLRLLDIVCAYNNIQKPIDFVVGHTFPLSLQPYYRYLFLDFIDQSKVDNKMEQKLDELKRRFEQNPYFKHYFGGHFHDDKELTDKYTMLYNTVADIKDYI